MAIPKIVTDQRQWWAYRARVRALPRDHRAAAEAVRRYLMGSGRADGAGWASLLADLAGLFEQSAADGTPIRDVFGNDPVGFADEFARNYPEGRRRLRERRRFVTAIARAAGADESEKTVEGEHNR